MVRKESRYKYDRRKSIPSMLKIWRWKIWNTSVNLPIKDITLQCEISDFKSQWKLLRDFVRSAMRTARQGS